MTNSVRVELRDLLLIFRTIAERPHLLTRGIVSEVYVWLNASVNLINVILDALLHEVMNETALKVEDMGALKARKRVLAVGRVQRSLTKLVETQEIFTVSLPPGEQFEKLCDAAGELRECVELLSILDGVLPGLLHEGFPPTALKNLEKAIFVFLAENAGGMETVDGIMTRWMTKKQTQYMKNCRGLLFSRGKVSRARAKKGAEHTILPREIGRLLDEEEKVQSEMQNVMDPEVQHRLNFAARERLARKFNGFVAANDWSDDDQISCSSPE